MSDIDNMKAGLESDGATNNPLAGRVKELEEALWVIGTKCEMALEREMPTQDRLRLIAILDVASRAWQGLKP